MRFDDLRYFVNIANTRSFAKGASMSHVTPAAASKAVRRLEEALGVALFARTTRQVELTLGGEALLRTCERIFEEVSSLRAELTASGAVRGDVRIGAMEVFSIQLLPTALSELTEEYPDVRPRSYEMVPQRMEDLLLSGRLDVGFTIGGGDVRGLRYHPLGTSRGVLVCGRRHPLYRRGRVSKAALREHTFVAPEFLGMEHLPALDQFPDGSYPRRVGATIELLQMGVQLAVEGRHLGYFPEVSVRSQLDSGALKALSGLRHHARFQLRAIVRDGGPTKPFVPILIEQLRREVKRR